jgi:hypothetical protein
VGPPPVLLGADLAHKLPLLNQTQNMAIPIAASGRDGTRQDNCFWLSLRRKGRWIFCRQLLRFWAATSWAECKVPSARDW